MSNFVPNEIKTFCPREPEWLNRDINNLIRKQNKLSKIYKKNGYKNEDTVIMDRLRKECPMAIKDAKEEYFTDLGAKRAAPSTGQKVC